MPHEKTRGIVLRAIDYSETSQILALCTEASGLVHAIAKGSRRGAMKGISVPDVLDCCEIVFVPKTPPALSVLTEWRVLDAFRGLRSGLDRLYPALYAVGLVLATTDRAEDDAPIFRGLYHLLRQCAAGEPPMPALVRFELQLLDALGVVPATGACVHCGRRLSGRVWFSPAAGGALCVDCRTPDSDAVPAMAGALASMALVREANGERGARLRLSAATASEMRRLLDEYWTYVLGHPVRLRRHLSEVGVRRAVPSRDSANGHD